MSDKRAVIHWFRKGQRIHDNPALKKACDLVLSDLSKYVLRPIFILDPGLLNWMSVGPNRYRFLQQSLTQLNERLTSIGSRLYVIRGIPKEVFSRIFEEWNVEMLTFELDIEPYAKQRDAQVESLAKKQNITIVKEMSHTIYDPELVVAKNNGKPPLQYQSFISIVEKMRIPEPVEEPKLLPPESVPFKDSLERENELCYDVPNLEEVVRDMDGLGECKYPGGETEALARLDKYVKATSWICNFEKPKTSPNSILPSTTVLSPYLKFGCLSSRFFYKRLRDILGKNPKHSKPPVSLAGQLMWREFYYAAAAGVPNFDKMVGNSICYQIPWEENKDHLQAWKFGRTGYPFIDALMRQLRQEGWIHHLGRHAVACFLTRGDLWISWEEGQKVFEEYLLDADWALNAGNWMWLSASCFFYQYFRVYSPVSFGKKTDVDGKFIKKYVPELQNYPSDIIYEPWKATLAAQQSYGCVIGKDYPKRIVVHEDVLKRNMGRMADAYKKHKESLALDKPENKKLNLIGNETKTLDGKRKADASQSNKTKVSKTRQTSLKRFLK